MLTETAGAGGYVSSLATFRSTLPKRTLIRVVFPFSQAARATSPATETCSGRDACR